MKKKLPKMLQSSADPSKLALTVKGILLGIMPLVIALFAYFGLDFTTNDYAQAVEQITALLAISMTFVGAMRKFYYFIKSLIKKYRK